MTRSRGTVVWSDDPFKDDPEAGRPWLVVSTESQPFRDEQYMAVGLSTSGHDEAVPIDEADWEAGSVPHRSYVLPWAVHSPKERFVEERVGKLSDDLVERVVEQLVSYVRGGG